MDCTQATRDAATELIANRKQCRVTKRNPCPICGKAEWCLANEKAALCPRSNGEGAVGLYTNYGWLHILKANAPMPTIAPKPPKKRPSDRELHARWEPIARRLTQDSEKGRHTLAKMLGVAVSSLKWLGVGYGECAGRWCWTFPTRSHLGYVLGISRRLVEPQDGKTKMHTPDSRSGLFYSPAWKCFGAPIFLVEGGSDVAAGLTMGLCAIGRPSNVGGIEYLTKMLREERDRKIVVVGERDRKPIETLKGLVRQQHEAKRCYGCAACWPGRYGAKETAAKLTERLGRPVGWKLPPDGAKDMRDWLVKQNIDVEDARAAFAAGQRWRELLA